MICVFVQAQIIKQRSVSQSKEDQAFIKSVLEQPKTYINFEALAEKLESGKDILKSKADDLIDTQRLINDVKKGKSPEVIHDHLMDSTIDVVSLADVM